MLSQQSSLAVQVLSPYQHAVMELASHPYRVNVLAMCDALQRSLRTSLPRMLVSPVYHALGPVRACACMGGRS